MVIKQVRFRCEGDDAYFGGILVECDSDTFIICGCCGGVMDMDDIAEIKEYENWVDISNEIIGE